MHVVEHSKIQFFSLIIKLKYTTKTAQKSGISKENPFLCHADSLARKLIQDQEHLLTGKIDLTHRAFGGTPPVVDTMMIFPLSSVHRVFISYSILKLSFLRRLLDEARKFNFFVLGLSVGTIKQENF